MIGWLVAVWALGVVAVMATEVKMHGSEWAALAAWPVTVPFFTAIRKWERWRWTCSDCRRWYGDREHYGLHMQYRTGCPGAPR